MFPPDSYQAIGWLVVGLASLCVAVNQIDDFFERRNPRPGFPPAEQLASTQQALAERVQDLEHALDGIRREMKEDREAAAKSASIRAAGLYKRVEEIRAQLAASLEAVRQELTENQ